MREASLPAQDAGSDGRGDGRVAVRVWDPLVRLTHWTIAAAIVLNGAIVDEESLAHVWIGYAALGVLALRLVWGLIGPKHARFSAFPPSIGAALTHVADTLTGRAKPHLSHNPLGALMVYALWGLLAAVSLTGVAMETDALWGMEAVEDVHEAAANLLMILAALHVAGVVIESKLSGVNLARAMIDGIKRMPANGR